MNYVYNFLKHINIMQGQRFSILHDMIDKQNFDLKSTLTKIYLIGVIKYIKSVIFLQLSPVTLCVSSVSEKILDTCIQLLSF